MNMQSIPDPEEFVDPLSDYEPVIYPSAVEQALMEGSVGEIQVYPYAEISAELTVRHAVHALYGLKISSLLVVDHGELVGVFTERDVLERVAESFAKVADKPIRDFMTRNPVVVYHDDVPAAALAAIATGGYRHVPVIDRDQRLMGVISPRRVFHYLEEKFTVAPQAN